MTLASKSSKCHESRIQKSLISRVSHSKVVNFTTSILSTSASELTRLTRLTSMCDFFCDAPNANDDDDDDDDDVNFLNDDDEPV